MGILGDIRGLTEALGGVGSPRSSRAAGEL